MQIKINPENLEAWLDGELPEAEAAEVTRHMEACADCRKQARTYTQLTEALVDYRATAPARRWPRIAAWVGAAAAAVILAVVLWPRPHTVPAVAGLGPQVPASRPPAPLVQPVKQKKPVRPAVVHKKRAPARLDPPGYTGPVIRVAIPADALFAPCAVPPGTQIYADLTLSADGSPRELRLLP